MHLLPGLATALVCGSLLLVSVPTSQAANVPGDPCAKPGEVVALGGGSIECLNGTWAPSQKQPASASAAGGASSVKAIKNFTTLGPALTQTTFNTTTQQVADASAVRLADGRVRIYAWVNPVGVRSATSTDAAGTNFIADASIPIPWTMAGQPRIVPLTGTTFRLFTVYGGNINAAISTDSGVTFTDEGPVITSAQAGFEPGGLTVVKQGRGYRAYFSNLEKPGERAERVMRTATSTDMLNWTMGPVITGTAGSIRNGGSHPFALIGKSGTIALYYAGDRGSSYGILVSTSKNGVEFGNERSVIAGGGDPDIIAVGKKKWRMYYGSEVSSALGFGILVAKSKGNAIP